MVLLALFSSCAIVLVLVLSLALSLHPFFLFGLVEGCGSILGVISSCNIVGSQVFDNLPGVVLVKLHCDCPFLSKFCMSVQV